MKLHGLYAISPEFKQDADLFKWAESLFEQGVVLLQYRDKTHDFSQCFQRAKTLCRLAHQYHSLLIINDNLLLTLKANADGVHLGKNDGSLFLARQLLGKNKILGVSCYSSLKNAQIAEKLGADYVAFGAVFPSPTKPQAPQVALSKIALAKMALNIPVCAIGGITPENAAQVLKSDVDFIAISHALLDSPKISVNAIQSLFRAKVATNDNEH